MGNLDAYQQNLSFNVISFIKKRLKISWRCVKYLIVKRERKRERINHR